MAIAHKRGLLYHRSRTNHSITPVPEDAYGFELLSVPLANLTRYLFVPTHKLGKGLDAIYITKVPSSEIDYVIDAIEIKGNETSVNSSKGKTNANRSLLFIAPKMNETAEAYAEAFRRAHPNLRCTISKHLFVAAATKPAQTMATTLGITLREESDMRANLWPQEIKSLVSHTQGQTLFCEEWP